MENQWIIPLLSGFVASTLTFIFSLIRERKQLKINNRAYLSIDEIMAGDKLKDYKVKPNTRLIMTENYRKIEQNIKNGTIKNPRLNYLKIKNIGPGLIINCKIKIKVGFNQSGVEEHYINATVSLVEKDEEIFIVTDDYAAIYTYFIKNLQISYKTQAGEQMLFVRNADKVDDKTNYISDSYYIKEMIGFNKKLSFTGNNEEWILINH